MVGELSAIEELRKMQSSKPRGAKCTAGLHLRTLPEEERAALVEALRDELIDANTISIWLDRKGYKVGRHTIARHRRGECQCR